MEIQEIANKVAEYCSKGDYESAQKEFYAQECKSVEPMGEQKEVQGMEAIKAKGEWWENTFETKELAVKGPAVNGNQFTLEFDMTTINKETKEEEDMHEVALYTVENGKIVEERFFY